MYAETFGCMYADFGCMSVERLGACMRLLSASIWKLLGACMRILGACIWSGWVHVCGCWVQSMRLLGAKYADVGCMYAETFGCMYAVVGCKSDSG